MSSVVDIMGVVSGLKKVDEEREAEDAWRELSRFSGMDLPDLQGLVAFIIKCLADLSGSRCSAT